MMHFTPTLCGLGLGPCQASASLSACRGERAPGVGVTIERRLGQELYNKDAPDTSRWGPCPHDPMTRSWGIPILRC